MFCAWVLINIPKIVNQRENSVAIFAKSQEPSSDGERHDDDVKYARRDWNDNIVFGGKMKLKRQSCLTTTRFGILFGLA